MFTNKKKYESKIQYLEERLKEAREEASNLRSELANLSLVLEDYTVDDITEGLYCLNSIGERRRVHCINGSWYVYRSLGSRFGQYKNAVLPLSMTEGYSKDIEGMSKITKWFCFNYMKRNGYVIANNSRV